MAIVTTQVKKTACHRRIPGFYDYVMNKSGQVLTRFQPGGAGRRGTIWWLRTAQTDERGRKFVTLRDAGRSRRLRLSRLLLLTFRGPAPPGTECCHENGDETDDRLRNLRWDTRLSNCEDKRRHGTSPFGERNGNAKITRGIAITIRKRWQQGERQADLAAEFGIGQPAVSQICRGVTWA